MNKFKINDEVRVVADEKRLSIICRNTTLTGKTGIVKQYCSVEGITLPWLIDLGSESSWFAEQDLELVEPTNPSNLTPVSHKDYMSLSDAYDAHSKNLMGLKGEEYAIDGDFLAMENRLAGMLGDTPEYVSLVMAGKHITALGIILLKNEPDEIKLVKLDERVRDACNLLKIAAAFVHAKQNDFSLHLGKEEKHA